MYKILLFCHRKWMYALVFILSRYRHYHSCSFLWSCVCASQTIPSSLYETCKKKIRVNLEDRITSFRSCFHSSSVAVYNEREKKGEGEGESERGRSKEKNRSSLLAIKTKLNCSSYQPMLLFSSFFFNKRKVRIFDSFINNWTLQHLL
jgi:hypothetical protein